MKYIFFALLRPVQFIKAILRAARHIYFERRCGGWQLQTIDIRQFFISQNVKSYTYLDGTSTVLDIALLKSLAETIDGCRYLEIGTHRGESLRNVMSRAEEYLSISKDYDLRYHYIVPSGVDIMGVRMCEDSVMFDAYDVIGKFDLIFIDGSHRYEDVVIDTRNAFDLLADGGYIVWHDYGLTAEKVNWEILAAINSGCPSLTESIKIYHVSNTLCAIYTTRRLVKTDEFKLFNIDVHVENR